jgi:hypothetical protein
MTFLHNLNSCAVGMILVAKDINDNSWVKIDLGVSKTVRSLYLAVPEHPNWYRLENLGIYIGDTGTWTDDSLCWLG